MVLEPRLQAHTPRSTRRGSTPYWWWLGALGGGSILVLVVSTVVVVMNASTSSNGSETKPVGTTLRVETIAAPLTGLPLPPEVAARRPWAVVVSNLPASRPQTGLSQADVVLEAPAEAGITRYLGVFQSQLPERVGPVRSARPYFNDWASSFNALYSHSGGSSEALEQLKAGYGNLQDVNEFWNGAAYQRDPSKKAPHNLFTGLERFWNYTTTHNWLGFKGFVPFVFGTVLTPGVATTNFTIPYQPNEYQVRYDWDAANQSWRRSVGGKVQTDTANNATITTKNVVVMVTDIVPMPNDPLLKVTITTLGSGRAILLRDGYRYEGRWAKPTLDSALTFTDVSGNPLPLAVGNTWISVIDKSLVNAVQAQP